MSTTAPLPTGGQINVAGILYQMLVSLADGLETTVSEYPNGGGSAPIVLNVEPFDGGDVQVHGRQRVVVQIKTRARHLRWTTGKIIGDVLPDLLKAVGGGQGGVYQFVTDNDAGCDDFRRFLRWFQTPEADRSTPAPTTRLGRGGRKVSSEVLLAHILATLVPDKADGSKVLRLLGSLQVVLRDRADLIRTINEHLRPLIERPEDLRHKRKQLIGELVDLGSTGSAIRTTQLLEGAGLDPRRLMLALLLPKLLKRRMRSSFRSLGYEPERDVRGEPAMPVSPVTVLRGESGSGKSWRLCATASALTGGGRLAVLVRATVDLEGLRAAVASAVWNPIYGSVAPLASVADRLRARFADDRGVWLTVLLDDLNDPELACRIVEDDWASLGIDIVASCQPPTADWLRQSGASPKVVDVPGFNIHELIRYLDEHGVRYADVRDDILELLFKPVLARLFCQLPHGISLRAETEYELLASFWRHAAIERPSQVRHPFDLERLQLVVGDMLAGPVAYPWPPAAFVRTLDDATVSRLMEGGVVELDGDRRLSMTHDRLLNWAMATRLAAVTVDENLNAAQTLDLIQRVEGLATVGGVALGRRLGYVLMDLLWLLLGPGRRSAADVAAVTLAYMRAPGFDAHDRAFLTSQLPTLGSRATPLLRAMAEADYDDERERWWPGWIGEGMRAAADVAWDEARAAASALFSSGEPGRIEIALRVIAKVGAPDLADELFALVMLRTSAMAEASIDDRGEAIRSKERAFDAFARSAAGDPSWLDGRIAATTSADEAEQLLWALVTLDRGTGLQIWRARRDWLSVTIPAGRRILPRAMRTFAEPDDLARLDYLPEGEVEMLHGAVTFDAIARLDPVRAIATLADGGTCPVPDLRGTEGWWMPGLHHRAGDTLASALRARAARAGEGAADGISQAYGGDPGLIDPASVDVVLDGLEATLADKSVPREQRLRRSWRMISLLSALRSKANLDRVAARRGGRLEEALAKLAIDHPPSSARVVDRELEMTARLLAVMAGGGFDRMTLAQIASTGSSTAGYGLGHALWTSSEDVGRALEALAVARTDADDDRTYQLMQALAAHGRDAGLVRLIEGSSPVYTHATSIRQARAGETTALLGLIRSKASSGSIKDRVQAVDLSHFLEADLSMAATAPLVATAAPGDAVAVRLLNQHLHRGRYDPALLPKLAPILSHADEAAARAALHLALHGDATGRTAAATWLDRHGLEIAQWQGAQAAFALLDHDDSRAGALSFLQRLNERDLGFGRLNADMLDALAKHGDARAADQLSNLAYASATQDLDAVAGAVRIAARTDAHGAFQAARRLFAKSGQLEAAQLLMTTNPAAGLTELMAAYVGADLPKRLAIARNLRWGAAPELLLPALLALAGSPVEEERRIAAEISGWLPAAWEVPWLVTLAADPVQAVEQAALASIARRDDAVAAEELIGAIPDLPKPRQWAFLRTVIESVDPHLLIHEGDPLDVRAATRRLPEEFAIEAQRLLDRRRQEVERKEREAGRREG